jgi:hypothetical protein
MVDLSDGPRPDDVWRAKLEEAQRRYSVDPNAETRAEFRRLLRLFAGLSGAGPNAIVPGITTAEPAMRITAPWLRSARMTRVFPGGVYPTLQEIT